MSVRFPDSSKVEIPVETHKDISRCLSVVRKDGSLVQINMCAGQQ